MINHQRNFVGQYTIEQIQPQPDGKPTKIKVKVRLNRNGIFDVTQAFIVDQTDEFARKKFYLKNFPIVTFSNSCTIRFKRTS